MQYRRARIKGGTYFFTVVTFRRQKLLIKPENVTLLRDAFRRVKKRHPFIIDAFVLLPDHLHCIWTMPQGDDNFSKRWRLIKSIFTRNYDCISKPMISASRRKKKEQAVWQRRFWEHTIRNERDFSAHCDYIHYNPVKHGLVEVPRLWPYSTFHRYVEQGIYTWGWGSGNMKLEEIGCE